MTQRRLAKRLSIGLACLGLVYVLWTAALIASAEGSAREVLSVLLHNPGKHLFHLLLLPVASYLAVSEFPLDLLRERWRSLRLWLLPLPLLAGVGVAFVVDDGVAAFEGASGGLRPSYMADLKDPDRRRAVVEFDEWARDRSHGHIVRLEPPPPDAAVEVTRQQAFSKLYRGEWVRAADGPNFPTVLTLRPAENAKAVSFWADAGWSAWFALFLSALGPAFVVWLVSWLLLHTITGRPPTPRGSNAMLAVIAISILWLPLASYSQWHLSYQEGLDYPPLVLAGVALLFVLGMAWLARRAPKAGWIVLLGSSALPLLGLLDALFNAGQTLVRVGRGIESLGLFGMAATYLLLGYVCAVIAKVTLNTPP